MVTNNHTCNICCTRKSENHKAIILKRFLCISSHWLQKNILLFIKNIFWIFSEYFSLLFPSTWRMIKIYVVICSYVHTCLTYDILITSNKKYPQRKFYMPNNCSGINSTSTYTDITQKLLRNTRWTIKFERSETIWYPCWNLKLKFHV